MKLIIEQSHASGPNKGQVFSKSESNPGWTDASEFTKYLAKRNRETPNKRITLIDNGYSEISEDGNWVTTVRAA